MREFRSFIFKWRGAILTPVTLLLLWVSQPSPGSLWCGALVCLLGEGTRLWAIGFAGEPTRSQELEAPRLVTAGPYSLVRNPLYLGNLLNASALAVAALGNLDSSWRALVLVVTSCSLSLVYGSIVPLEEEFLEERFGEEYLRYRQNVPALLPRHLLPQNGSGEFSWSRALTFERTTLMWLVLIWSVLFWKTSV